MKIPRTLVVATMVLALGCSLAQAQSRPDRPDRRDGPQRPVPSQYHPQQRPHYNHQMDRRGPPPRPAMYRDGRGAGPDHRWYRGDRMPQAYRGNSYVVNDWRSHRLYAPPRGYHWVQNGADYLLVAVATGIIAQIILSQ